MAFAPTREVRTTQATIKYYQEQHRHRLGHSEDQVRFVIYLDGSIHQDWIPHLNNSVVQINSAAPGVLLLFGAFRNSANICIYGTTQQTAYTRMPSSGPKSIYLGHNWENKKRTSVHEILHALGFTHEQSRCDSDRYLKKTVPVNSRWYPQYNPDQCDLAVTPIDPFSVMMYSENDMMERKTGTAKAWSLKKTTRGNDQMSELDKVRLNILYKPCKSRSYSPKISEVNGMVYCGRQVMQNSNCPSSTYNDLLCGPREGPNCPACRVLKTKKVLELVGEGRWQGWSGWFYCGRRFVPDESGSDGECGPNNGLPCPTCRTILCKNFTPTARFQCQYRQY